MCDLMRIHYVDIRTTWDIKDDASMYTEDVALHLLRSLFRSGLEIKKKSREIMDVVKRVNLDNNVILSMLKRLIKGDKINLLDVFYENKSLKKELNASYKKAEIIRFLKVMSHAKVGNVPLFISGIKSLISSIENNTEVNLNFIKKSESVFLNLNSLLLDCYCLSRIFKFHNVKKNKNKEEFQPEESKNIIIYVGDNHAANMTEFINSIGFNPVYSYYEPKEKSCINMKKPNMYLRINLPLIPIVNQPIVNQPIVAPVKKIPLSQLDQSTLKKLKVGELVSIAKQLGCKGYTRLKKTDLIELIIKTIKMIQSPKAQAKPPKQSPPKAQVKPPKQSPKAQVKPPINQVYLNKLTVVQLRNFAKEIGAKGYSKLNKADLIAFIINTNK
jgi:hypothetical protein